MTAYKEGSIGALRSRIAAELAELDSPRLEADLILAHHAGKDRSWVHAHVDDPAPAELVRSALETCARRAAREPLQYILGEWEFMGLPFFVGPGALIPRQDTETLCEAALGWLKNRPGARVLDLCCGTGCIGVSLAKLGGAAVSFADISPDALALAKRNAEKIGVDGPFYESDLLADVPGVYDLIACNPPYLTAAEMENCQKELTFEPALALFGGEDGLDFYRRLAAAWADHVAPGGLLLLEIGHTQGAAVRGLFPGARILKDICGLDRVAWVERI